jgi:thiol-disulfide isomerase/thioredoxin
MQAGKLADGDKRLKDLFEEIQTVKAGKAVAGYVKIRLLSAEYAVAIQQKGADVAAIQVKWVKSLEEFVEEYPDIPDTAEALLQLGIAREYAGQDDDAKKWYERVVREFHDAPQAKKAAGAVVRLDSIGKVLRLSGAGLNGGTVDLSSYRGRVIVLQYWATWSAPAKSDLESLKKLSSQLGNSLAIVGVSVDNNAKDVRAFLKENPLPWPQIFEEGGQDSRPANALGVISVPTMILLDADGKVVDRNVQMADLESAVKKLVK